MTSAAKANRNAEIVDRLEAENERLRETLTEISKQYENIHITHVDFRVWAKQVADAALAPAPTGKQTP